MTSIAASIGMTGMFRRFPYTLWMMLSVMAFTILAPSSSHAGVSTMKAAPARGLIGLNGSQPVSLSTAQWAKALGDIRYTNETFFASDSPEAVFSDQQIHALAPQMQQAFAAIGTGQAVAFHQGKTRGGAFFSGGRLYWHFSRIKSRPAFKLTNLAEENARTSHAVEAIPEEDIDRSYWTLAPRQGQSLYRDRPDMLAMPVSSLTPDTSNALPAVQQSEPPARMHSHAAVMASAANHGAKKRIDTLHRLLVKDLITKDEYREKLEVIISEYETQHPSPEAGLEFLRTLDKKGLIAPDMLQKKRKQLLDRL